MPAAEELAAILRDAVKSTVFESNHIQLMFSGGVDSAVLAVAARKFCDVELVVAGMEGSNDLEWGSQAGEMLDLPVNQIIFTNDDVIQSMKNVVLLHHMENPRWMSTFTAFDIVLSRIEGPTVLCGQGADELFGGYMKYRDMESALAEVRMKGDTNELLMDELPIHQAMARHYGLDLKAPYLVDPVIGYAGSVPLEMKLGPENKQILRDAAVILGVPGSMAKRPKKAMQYGSGVSKAIKSHVKASGTDLSGLIDNIKNIGNLYE